IRHSNSSLGGVPIGGRWRPALERRRTGFDGDDLLIWIIPAHQFSRDSLLEQAGFEPVWGFSCQAVVLGCAASFLFGAGKAVFRPVACDQVRGARGRGQGTETVAKLGGLPPSVACVSQRLDA